MTTSYSDLRSKRGYFRMLIHVRVRARVRAHTRAHAHARDSSGLKLNPLNPLTSATWPESRPASRLYVGHAAFPNLRATLAQVQTSLVRSGESTTPPCAPPRREMSVFLRKEPVFRSFVSLCVKIGYINGSFRRGQNGDRGGIDQALAFSFRP